MQGGDSTDAIDNPLENADTLGRRVLMEQSPIVPTPQIVLAHEQPFRIGPAEIRPATREYVHNGHARIAEPRVMQMLVALHRADGGVVSKDDLIGLCWEGRVVGEDAINRVVSRLRHDAVEKAGGAFKVETITKVGYRLVGADGAARNGGAAGPVDRRRALAIGGSVLAVAGGSAVAWRMFQDEQLPPEAQRLYDQGWSALRDGTVDQYANAVAKFRMAADLAPNHAVPWGGLALAYQKQAESAPSGQHESLKARGNAAARRALAIDPNNGDAIAASILVVPTYRNWIAKDRACREAIARAPRHPAVNIAMAALLGSVGRARASLPYVERAFAAEPMVPGLHMFRATTLWDIGRLEEAESAMDRAFRLWPRHYAIWFSRFNHLIYSDRAQEALAMVADIANRPTGIPDWNFEASELVARALANPGRASLEAATTAMLGLAKRGVGFAQNAIAFASATNQIDIAFSILDAFYFNRGFALGEQRYSKEQAMYSAERARDTYFLFMTRTANVRRDARFAPLLEELGLEQYWQSSGTVPDYRALR